MTQTTIIISNLAKEDFVSRPRSSLSLANQIKLAILNLPPLSNQKDFLDSISHWSDLPFLSRIIIMFKTAPAASHAHEYLQASYQQTRPFTMPQYAKISLQENLLQRSRSSDALREGNDLKVTDSLAKFRSRANRGSEPEYHEPEPKPFDMYKDLLRSGIDISQFNTEEEVQEVRSCSPSSALSQDRSDSLPTAVGRSRSVTKTLFRPSLSVDPISAGGGDAPRSPTITLDQSF